MGLSLSSSKKKIDFGRYDWAATHACETNAHAWDGNFTDHASANGYNFEKGLELAADGNLRELGNQAPGDSIQDLLTTAGNDFGDKITFSMWIKPMWSHTGTTSSGNWSNGLTILPLFQMNTSQTADGADRAIFCYINFRSGSSFRNRMTIWTDAGTDRAGCQRAMHDANSVTGTGSSGSSINSLWDTDNPGNTNGQGFVHLVFTRDVGTQQHAWDVFWNGQDIGMSIDVGQGDDEPEVVADNVNFLGIGGYRAINSNYDSGNSQYNFALTPMRIRDFAVFKGVMNQKDITEIYNSGNFVDIRTKVGNFSSLDLNQGPVLYYPLNHNTADYSRNSADLSGNVSFVEL
jgi:hypothetical protein